MGAYKVRAIAKYCFGCSLALEYYALEVVEAALQYLSVRHVAEIHYVGRVDDHFGIGDRRDG